MHTIRRNLDVTVLAHDNKVYGLTKGQASPTSDVGMETKAQPHGVVSESFNPIGVALSLGVGFVARGFSGETAHLSKLIQAAIKHRGFSLIDILQPYVSFNRINTFGWYKKRVYDLNSEGYSPDNLEKAWQRSREWGERIPLGIFYRKEKPTFTDQFEALESGPLIHRNYDHEKVRLLTKG